MTNQPLMPNSSVDQHLLDNLRHARLELEELGLEFDAVLARFDEEIRQQRLQRVRNSLSLLNK